MDLALPSDWLCVETSSMMCGECMLLDVVCAREGGGEGESVATLEGLDY